MNVLITAGPTREYLDPVRYISNESSGKMGFAFAQAVRTFGADVTLVAGPVALETPRGVTRIDVVSAEEMRRAVMRLARNADVIIMAAAVADARPRRHFTHKLKKPLKPIQLSPTPDILAELGSIKRDDQVLVGFALETSHMIARATKKLRTKGCDWIVANTERAVGAAASQATLISQAGAIIRLPLLPKHDLAMMILSHILA